jgi:hypothetical protein
MITTYRNRAGYTIYSHDPRHPGSPVCAVYVGDSGYVEHALSPEWAGYWEADDLLEASLHSCYASGIAVTGDRTYDARPD